MFNPQVVVGDSEIWLSGDQAKYVSRVLRLRVNDRVVMFDGRGGEYLAVILEIANDRVRTHVGPRRVKETESPLAIQLIHGISRGARMDLVVQKSTELGVRRITPVITEYSVVKLDADKAVRRRDHWLKVCQSACEQCGRNTLPDIDVPQALNDWLSESPGDGTMKITLDPHAGESVAKLPVPDSNVALLIGPEGGLSDAEQLMCEQAGFSRVSLGPRILRTETAAIASVAVLQACWGDFK